MERLTFFGTCVLDQHVKKHAQNKNGKWMEYKRDFSLDFLSKNATGLIWSKIGFELTRRSIASNFTYIDYLEKLSETHISSLADDGAMDILFLRFTSIWKFVFIWYFKCLYCVFESKAVVEKHNSLVQTGIRISSWILYSINKKRYSIVINTKEWFENEICKNFHDNKLLPFLTNSLISSQMRKY